MRPNRNVLVSRYLPAVTKNPTTLVVWSVNYLKEYFKKGKTSINIIYRRKYGNEFKQTSMEMIPANDYNDNNQSLFLYVKLIDK